RAGTWARALVEGGDVGDGLADAALSGQTLALAVAAADADRDAKARCKKRHDERPLHMVDPRTVHEHERAAGAELLEEDTDAVDVLDWHIVISECRLYRPTARVGAQRAALYVASVRAQHTTIPVVVQIGRASC